MEKSKQGLQNRRKELDLSCRFIFGLIAMLVLFLVGLGKTTLDADLGDLKTRKKRFMMGG